MVCCESREIGYEEEIEEEFNAVGFGSLREDEGVVVCAYKRRFDPWRGLVKTLEMLLLVAKETLVPIFEVHYIAQLELGKRTHRAGKC